MNRRLHVNGAEDHETEGAVSAEVPPAVVADRLVIEPLLSLDELTRVLGCSRRKVEQLKSSGRLPTPDLHIGRLPRWKAETIRTWIDEQARGRGARR